MSLVCCGCVPRWGWCAAQYKGMFKECLDRAAEEAKEAGAAGALPETAALAQRIEAAFFKHFRAHLRLAHTDCLAVLPMRMANFVFLLQPAGLGLIAVSLAALQEQLTAPCRPYNLHAGPQYPFPLVARCQH